MACPLAAIALLGGSVLSPAPASVARARSERGLARKAEEPTLPTVWPGWLALSLGGNVGWRHEGDDWTGTAGATALLRYEWLSLGGGLEAGAVPSDARYLFGVLAGPTLTFTRSWQLDVLAEYGLHIERPAAKGTNDHYVHGRSISVPYAGIRLGPTFAFRSVYRPARWFVGGWLFLREDLARATEPYEVYDYRSCVTAEWGFSSCRVVIDEGVIVAGGFHWAVGVRGGVEFGHR